MLVYQRVAPLFQPCFWQAKSFFGHLGVQNIQGLQTESAKHLQGFQGQGRFNKGVTPSPPPRLASAPAHFVATHVPGFAAAAATTATVTRMFFWAMGKGSHPRLCKRQWNLCPLRDWRVESLFVEDLLSLLSLMFCKSTASDWAVGWVSTVNCMSSLSIAITVSTVSTQPSNRRITRTCWALAFQTPSQTAEMYSQEHMIPSAITDLWSSLASQI